MHTTLASIEENVSRLDSDVEDLKTKSKQLGSTVNELKESIQDLLKEGKCKTCGTTRREGFLFFIHTFLKHCKALSTEKYRHDINIIIIIYY